MGLKSTITKEKLKSKSKAGIVLRPSTPEIKDDYIKIKGYFEKQNIEIFLEKNSANMIDEEGY